MVQLAIDEFPKVWPRIACESSSMAMHDESSGNGHLEEGGGDAEICAH